MTRPTVTTSKDINLSQLDAELGGFGLCGDENDPAAKIVMVATESSVTQSDLAAAVDAHVAGPDDDTRTVDEKLAEAGLTVDELRSALGL
jgi:hypothetical protein